MKKTDKKIDKKLREALTNVCEWALDEIDGYQWISHSVNYDRFPASLMINCAFTSQKEIDSLKHSQQDKHLQKIIYEKLADVDIKLQDLNKQIKWMIA